MKVRFFEVSKEDGEVVVYEHDLDALPCKGDRLMFPSGARAIVIGTPTWALHDWPDEPDTNIRIEIERDYS